MINYAHPARTVRPFQASDGVRHREVLRAYIAGRSSDPNRPVVLVGRQSINLTRLAAQVNR